MSVPDEVQTLQFMLSKLSEESSSKHKRQAHETAKAALHDCFGQLDALAEGARKKRDEETRAVVAGIKAAMNKSEALRSEAQSLRVQALTEFGQKAAELKALSHELSRAAAEAEAAIGDAKKQQARHLTALANEVIEKQAKELLKELENIAASKKREVSRALLSCSVLLCVALAGSAGAANPLPRPPRIGTAFLNCLR
jgi:hypothetical protein